MQPAHLWWIAAALAVAAELATGTFYLLMLAIGLAAGALAAHGGLGLTGQIVSAAVVGAGAVALWTWRRGQTPGGPAATADPGLNLDIGETVHVTGWDADGSARVHHRGANWTVLWDGSPNEPPPGPGTYTIRALRGNRFIVGR
ncbi:NfeD family protein [Sphaerotilus mobilis]|uniref:Membrane protein implicated in regulation of membrane protease activity n=1 Tax=Sphaerotilus mobilis TaxID=47994 RepID=A0A4Q7LVU1_9BURK|nr:NfeD family protein [Sphaerotilus mobilis]RZS58098.1 membrane protein implicated in regulation of membrane protease activity [Sphaerotilus mobilis]